MADEEPVDPDRDFWRDLLLEDMRDLVLAARGMVTMSIPPMAYTAARIAAIKRLRDALEPFNEEGTWSPNKSRDRFTMPDPDAEEWQK